MAARDIRCIVEGRVLMGLLVVTVHRHYPARLCPSKHNPNSPNVTKLRLLF